jgi:hypothetical protein
METEQRSQKNSYLYEMNILAKIVKMLYPLLILGGILSSYSQNFNYSGYIYGTKEIGVQGITVKLYTRTSGNSAVTAGSEQFGVTNGSTFLARNVFNASPNNSTTYNYITTNAFTVTTAAGSATIAPFSSNIPANRNRGTSILYSSQADEASVVITFPSGFVPSFLGNNYTSGHVNANSWFTFGTASSNGYQGNANNPSAPTIHIGSVDNSFSDNNMTYTSTETYTDPYWGEVFRIRYEGNSKYSQSGIDTIWDLYFIKNQPTKQLVVWRQFVTDGSSTSISGTPAGPWTLNTTSTTNSSGYYNFNTSLSNTSYEFYIQIDTPTLTNALTTTDAADGNTKVLNGGLTSLDYYRYDVNNANSITVSDIYSVFMKRNGVMPSYSGTLPVLRIFTPTEFNTIKNSSTDLRSTYPGVQSITINSPTSGGTSNYYITRLGYSN